MREVDEVPVSITTWTYDGVTALAKAALQDGAAVNGRFVNGRIVAVLASPEDESCHYAAVGYSAIPAGISTEVHSHVSEEITTVIAGTGLVEIGDETLELEPGRTFITPSGIPHRTIAGDAETLLLQWVYTPPGSESRWLDPSKPLREQENI